MKVGTDGVLLGSWVAIDSAVTSILDIGTGTGLIALQLAQRFNSETIDALEIEPQAYEQAVDNFENSDWGNRLFCYHASLKEFALEMDEKYDLIVSNPPFFNDTYKKLEQRRALARHSENLTFGELLKKFPEAGSILSGYGLHCIGCHVGTMETIEQGVMAHGLGKPELDKMIDELNKSIQ